jgi:hypothetical protein
LVLKSRIVGAYFWKNKINRNVIRDAQTSDHSIKVWEDRQRMHIYNAKTQKFIERATKIYGSKFSYDCVVYTKSKTKVIICCNLHTYFQQSPQNHLKFNGCSMCQAEHKRKLYLDDTTKFITKAIEKYGLNYGYDKVNYKNSRSKVIIRCPSHGDFLQSPADHLCGCGCPRCNDSKGETKISNWLYDHNITFSAQIKIPNCKYKRVLPFDFGIYYGQSLIGLIEYQGEQHYIPIKRGNWSTTKTQERFDLCQIRDRIKRKFCSDEQIPFLEISYLDFWRIPEILENFTLEIKRKPRCSRGV